MATTVVFTTAHHLGKDEKTQSALTPGAALVICKFLARRLPSDRRDDLVSGPTTTEPKADYDTSI
jgi:hypothetical protein